MCSNIIVIIIKHSEKGKSGRGEGAKKIEESTLYTVRKSEMRVFNASTEGSRKF